MKKYLLYVRQYSFLENKYNLYIYKIKTNDIFHTIGEFYYRALEQVKRIDFVEYTPEKEKFWIDSGYSIYYFKDKYGGSV